MVRRLQLVWPMRAHTIIGVVYSEVCLGRWVSGSRWPYVSGDYEHYYQKAPN